MDKKNGVDEALSEEQLKILDYMGQLDPSSKEYRESYAALKMLEMLKKPKNGKIHWWNRVDPTIWVAIIGLFGNLASILLVMHYEELHIITTKAWSFAQRRFH